MLSIETPPDPSCSFNASALRTDERASDQLAFQEADPVGHVEAQAPNFSIRDYVFTSRSKTIASNWPFPQQFLKVCLNHGARNLLPPFEPPDLVRAQCCRKTNPIETQKISSQVDLLDIENVCSKGIKPNSCLPSDELVVESSDQARHPLPVILDDKLIGGDPEIVSTVTSNDLTERISDQIRELRVNRSLSEESSQLEVSKLSTSPAKLEISREPSEKKCRVVLKLCAISEARRPEDTLSSCSTVSDPMASKVCPVCKVFTSTSNTTLNAHIDQCLSVESDTKSVAENISKFKVKPRKKRLMEDIYVTAPYCTLEELDKRNGTNWATDLSLVGPSVEACLETKRPKLSPVATRDGVDEGAVYVDSNGIKLRILSKSNDMPPVTPREEFKLRKHATEIKEGKSLQINKEKQFSSKYLKHMKVKSLGKKLRSFGLYKGEMQAAPEGGHHADAPLEKEESQLQAMSPRDKVRGSGPATLRQWVCSKRSDIPKKIHKTDIHRSSSNLRPISRIPLSESNQPDLGSSPVVQSHILKFCRSSEVSASSSKAKGVDFQRSTGSGKPIFNSKWSSERTLTNGLVLKLSKSSGSSASCLSSKREEIPMGGSSQKATNSSDMVVGPEVCHHSLKAKKITTLKKNILVESPSFTLGASNVGGVGEKVTNSKKFQKHRSVLVTNRRGELPCHVIGTAKTVKTPKTNLLKCDIRPETEGILNQMPPRCSNILESEQEKEDITVVGQVPLGAEYPDTEIATEPALDSISTVEPKPSGEQNVQSVLGSESTNKERAPNLLDNQEMQCYKITCDETVSQKYQMVDEMEAREGYVESHAETISAQESSACLTSHEDVGLEIPQENSSITSIQMLTEQVHDLAHDHEQSLSPVSTASTISPPSPKDSKSKDSGAELFVRLESSGESRGKDTEEKNQEVEMAAVAKEPEQLSDGQPCCCLRREGLSGEFQSVKPSTMNGTVLSSKENQISNLYIVPNTSSYLNSYPSLRTNAIESPTESISTKSSSDSAVKFPVCSGFGSTSPSSTPSTPSSVLRLMGKNLMVGNKEESPQLPKVPSASNNQLPPFGFGSTSNFMNQEGPWHHYHHQLPSGSYVLNQVPPFANHQMPLHSGFMMRADVQIDHKKLNQKPKSSPASAHHHDQKRAVPSAQAPYMKEVIVIDDSPEDDHEPKASLVSLPSPLPTFLGVNSMMQQRPFSCFPSQSQFISRDLSGGFGPSFLNACPREFSNPMKGGRSISEGSVPPLLPSPFLIRSPSMYYSPNL